VQRALPIYDELSGQFFFNPPGAEAPAPAPQAANARCWLKKAVPRTLTNGFCVSGIKRLGQAHRAR